MRLKHLVVAAVAVLGITGAMDAVGGRTPTEVANIWVDTTAGACVRTLPRAYSDANACGSLAAAVATARSGDRILVRGGTYSDPQSILRRDGAHISIERARGQTPRFTSSEGIRVDAPTANLTLRGLSTSVMSVGTNCAATEAECGPRVRNLRLVDLDVQTFLIQYVDGVRWTRGDIGPADATAGFGHPWIDQAGDTGWAPKNIVIDGAYFHDIREGTSGTHTECLLITSADNVIVRNSRFKNCDSTGSLYITEINFPNGGGTYCIGVVIENNMFLGRDSHTLESVQFEDDCEITIRNNSFSRNAHPYLIPWQQNAGGNGPTRTVTVEGNYGYGPKAATGCLSLPPNFIFHDNVWLNNRCDPSDASVSHLDFVNPASDLHLKPGANAIDKGWKSSYPATDIDGQPRYSGAAPDAGVDETISPLGRRSCRPPARKHRRPGTAHRCRGLVERHEPPQFMEEPLSRPRLAEDAYRVGQVGPGYTRQPMSSGSPSRETSKARLFADALRSKLLLPTTRFRVRRMQGFLDTFPVSRETRILDVGGTEINWQLVEQSAEIVLLNINVPDAPPELPANIRYVEGDGTQLAYADGEFDICFSNSTIEHVHTYERQAAFAAEVRRVARGVWLQTPAREFPFEPHWLGLFIHWFPKQWQRRLARNFTVWGWVNRPTPETIDELLAEYRLLSFREMQALFPDCEVRRERFLGLTKSYIAIRRLPEPLLPPEE